jgi:hypothetical protein
VRGEGKGAGKEEKGRLCERSSFGAAVRRAPTRTFLSPQRQATRHGKNAHPSHRQELPRRVHVPGPGSGSGPVRVAAWCQAFASGRRAPTLDMRRIPWTLIFAYDGTAAARHVCVFCLSPHAPSVTIAHPKRAPSPSPPLPLPLSLSLSSRPASVCVCTSMNARTLGRRWGSCFRNRNHESGKGRE